MQVSSVPQGATADAEFFTLAADCDRICGVSLEFDGICASFFSGMNDFDCLIEILIMVGGEFGNAERTIVSESPNSEGVPSMRSVTAWKVTWYAGPPTVAKSW